MSACERCEAHVPQGAHFCPSCGFNLAAASLETGSLDIVETAPRPIGQPSLPDDVSSLEVVAGASAGERFLLMGPQGTEVHVGRSADTDIFLDDVTVSRHHGTFVRGESDWIYQDSGSLNGTYVNGSRVESVHLVAGDAIVIGKFHFVYRAGGAQ